MRFQTFSAYFGTYHLADPAKMTRRLRPFAIAISQFALIDSDGR
ncbi:MAG: hypothetical protein ABJ084_02720 [Halioglobus sp.]